ncbi:MAG TPA: DNA-directed RNA polymerase subunit B [Candidatus Nanoarchaeia archaeon]|nr:DNA-directed RNA polymerase subunit B [Candidatus Nanoarchaeia archaeon]
MVDVYLNGRFIGEVENSVEFVSRIKQDRRSGAIAQDVNVFYDDALASVFVESTRGRCRRPLIIVKDGLPLLTERHVKQLQKGELSWSDLVSQGIVEFLDAGEEENVLVAFSEKEITPEHTHLEISPLAMLGVIAGLIPYGDYIQSARLIIGTRNLKQSVGLYATNFPLRMDMDVNLLHYPQMPLVQTMMHGLSEYSAHPSGQNIVVAIMSFKGYNIEDAVILNKGSIERGFGRSSYFRPAVSEELRYSGGLMDTIVVPDKDVKGYKSERDYRFLEDDGIVYPEAKVKEEDVIIGKVSPPRFLSNLEEYSLASNIRRESSISLRHGEEGVVDFVTLTENEEGNKLVQVRLRDQRIPEIGDKFVSRHGQKGVVGLIVPESNMPFTASGIKPDLIFSPHGIPSRMTISHMIELIGGKTAALSGRIIDGTIFAGEPEEQIRKELVSLGFQEKGTETMYNGVTGEIMESKIFIGNMYYLRLKHMVANKIHSRARGPIQLLTRQPTEGRAKEGGLRLGEMEKDTFVAHGASLLLKERFDSDKTVVPVCEACGTIAIFDPLKDKRYCPIDGDNVEISDIEISYAFKLILDEFKSLGIYPRLQLRSKY